MKPDPLELPACPSSGKLSLASRYLPKDMRARSRSHRGKRTTKWLSTYKCKVCPYYHQTSGT